MDEPRKTNRSQSRPVSSTPASSRQARADDVTPADIRQTVGEVLRILVLRRWVFVVPFCVATSAAFVASHYIPRLYEATTRFEESNDPVSVNLPPPLVTSSFNYVLSTLEQDIKSEEVMLPVMEGLGMLDDLPRDAEGNLTAEGLELRADAVKALALEVNVATWQPSRFRSVIELRYTGPGPAHLMNSLLTGMKGGYKALVRRKVADRLRDARDWYAMQAGEKRSALDKIDRQVAAVRIQYPGVDPANPESITVKLTSLQGQLANLRRANSRLESRIASREAFLANAKTLSAALTPSGTGPVSETVGATVRWLQDALAESEAKVSELRLARGMTEVHPEIVAQRKLQEKYRQALEAAAQQDRSQRIADNAKSPEPAPDPGMETAATLLGYHVQQSWMPAVAQVEMDLASLSEQRELNLEESQRLQDQITEYVGMQGELLAQRQGFARLQERLDQARDDYETYQGLVSQCDQNLTVENQNRGILFTDVELPQAATVPVSPLAKTVILLSVMAGLVTGAVFVVIAELFDRRYRTSAQVARSLGLPILESVSEIVTAAQRRTGFVRRAVLAPAVAAALVIMVVASGGTSFLSLNHPESYERLMDVPRSVWANIAGPGDRPAAVQPTDRPV